MGDTGKRKRCSGVPVFRWPAARCFGGKRKERWLRAGLSLFKGKR
jgi:hypothetical protein